MTACPIDEREYWIWLIKLLAKAHENGHKQGPKRKRKGKRK